jgi:hypothetical protein
MKVNFIKSKIFAAHSGLTENKVREVLAREFGEGSDPVLRIKVTHYGLRVLGAPVGTSEFIRLFWRNHVRDKTAPLAARVQHLPSLQGRYRVHQSCMVNRGSFMARSSHPSLTKEACVAHDKIMLDGFRQIINEDVTPRIRQILKLPSSMAGLNCAMAADLAVPAFVAARAAAVAAFVEDPRMLAFMGISRLPGMAAEAPAKPPDPPDKGGRFKDLRGPALEDIERLRESVVSPLVAIVREHTAQSSPQSAPTESQEAMAAQPQGEEAVLGMPQDALRGVPMSLAALLQMGGAGGKLQHALSSCVNRVAFHDLYRDSDALQRSRLVSQAQRGANAWIEAAPTDYHLTMSDREFHWAMRYRVGSKELQKEDRNIACRCLSGKPPGAEVSLTHMSSCKYGGGAIKRHDTVLHQVNAMLRAAGIRTHLEPRARSDLKPTFGKGAPDIAAEDAGRHFFVEVMVSDQSQPALLSRSSTTPRVAAALAEAQKREKYLDRSLSLQYDLIPATFEEAGAFSTSTLNLIHDCSRAAFRSGRIHDKSAPWPANTFAGYWTQRLSVALRRGCFRMRESIRHSEASRL